MSTPYEVPLVNFPQRVSVAFGGATYILTARWNTAASVWVMDIADQDSNPVLQGIPMVGNTDLLEQFNYLNFGGRLIAQTDHDTDAPPTYDNLGTSGH